MSSRGLEQVADKHERFVYTQNDIIRTFIYEITFLFSCILKELRWSSIILLPSIDVCADIYIHLAKANITSIGKVLYKLLNTLYSLLLYPHLSIFTYFTSTSVEVNIPGLRKKNF